MNYSVPLIAGYVKKRTGNAAFRWGWGWGGEGGVVGGAVKMFAMDFFFLKMTALPHIHVA